MPYKDPIKQRDYNREYQRKRRSKDGYSSKIGVTAEWKLSTADDLKSVLETMVSEIMSSDSLDLGVKGRVVASLLTVGVRLLEVGSIEERLEKLEAKMLPVPGGGIRK
jgi:hypothetical protein